MEKFRPAMTVTLVDRGGRVAPRLYPRAAEGRAVPVHPLLHLLHLRLHLRLTPELVIREPFLI